MSALITRVYGTLVIAADPGPERERPRGLLQVTAIDDTAADAAETVLGVWSLPARTWLVLVGQLIARAQLARRAS